MDFPAPSRRPAQFQPSLLALMLIAGVVALPNLANALDGGTLRVTPYNGWKAFEVISSGENPSGDGFNYSMPGTFDGAGAWMVDATTLRVLVNHEQTVASISEVNLDLAALESAIDNMITVGNTGGGHLRQLSAPGLWPMEFQRRRDFHHDNEHGQYGFWCALFGPGLRA